MFNLLSGEKLVQAHSKTNYELPSAGVKEFKPNKSWLEGKQIQSALDERKALLEEERVEKWSSLMGAEWLPERGKARVTRFNKHWEVFGHHSDNADWLFPEEVLYLLEMNCLQCVFNEVPLSVEKGYSILLGAECSLNEYRVFSHLCRSGYRVVRHMPDLTVTAYERQIRLDQHLSERKTYRETTAGTVEDHPRPDLPPKKTLELDEDTEVRINSVQEEPSRVKEEVEVCSKKQIDIEVIDLVDSDDTSEDEMEDSSDSDIEVVHVSAPMLRTPKEEEEEEESDDQDVEIIEVPVPEKNIEVATIFSSDSEDVDNESNLDSDESCDGNWKRSRPGKKRRYVRPPTLSNLKYLAVEEFCVENRSNSSNSLNQTEILNGGGDCLEESNVEVENSNSVEFLSLEVPSETRYRPPFRVLHTRNEILDMIPTMAGKKEKLMTLESADLRLIPDNIRPNQESYTFNTNTLRAKVFSTYFRGGYRGRRNFHGPTFNNFSPYYNPDRNMLSNANTFQPIAQMFGNDVHSMARGMMQFASTLLNMPHNYQSNRMTPFIPQQASLLPTPGYNQSILPSPAYNQPILPSPAYNQPIRYPVEQFRSFGTPVHTRFSDSPFQSNRDSVEWHLQNPSFTPPAFNPGFGVGNDFDSSARAFTPPLGRGLGRGHHGRSRRPRGGNSFNRNGPFTPSPNSFREMSPALYGVDPAYTRPDLPMKEEENGEFIPLNSSNQNSDEVICVDNDDGFVPQAGISNRFLKKRKKAQKRKEAKRRRKNEMAGQNKTPEIIFLDNDSNSSTSLNNSLVKQEINGEVGVSIKSEPTTEGTSRVKQEVTENSSNVAVKTEVVTPVDEIKVERNVESGEEVRVKSEPRNDVRIEITQDRACENVHVEIEIGMSNDTSSSNSLHPSAVKTENNIKTEPEISNHEDSSTTVKTEPENVLNVKSENHEEEIGMADSPQNNNVSTEEKRLSENSESGLQASEPHIEIETVESIENISQNNKNSLQEIVNNVEVEGAASDNVIKDNQSAKENSVCEESRSVPQSAMEVEDISLDISNTSANDKSAEQENDNSSEEVLVDQSSSCAVSRSAPVDKKVEDLLSQSEAAVVKNSSVPEENECVSEIDIIDKNIESDLLRTKQTENFTSLSNLDSSEMDVDVSQNVPETELSTTAERSSIKNDQRKISKNSVCEESRSVPQSAMEDEDISLDISNTSANDKGAEQENDNSSEEVLVDQSSSCAVSRSAPVDKKVEDLLSQSEAAVVKNSSVPEENECVSEIDIIDKNIESDLLRTTQTENIASLSSLDSSEMDVDVSQNVPETELSKAAVSSSIKNDQRKRSKISNWAEVKKHNVPLTSASADQVETEEDNGSNEDGGDILPLVQPRHCKTIGTVLSALQIFSPFSPKLPENVSKLKISYDMYLSADFRKSQRGLPHFRIVVFGGAEPMPSPAQLHELQHRFQDSVPVLQAVVTPGSVVCYTAADVSLPIDLDSHRQ